MVFTAATIAVSAYSAYKNWPKPEKADEEADGDATSS